MVVVIGSNNLLVPHLDLLLPEILTSGTCAPGISAHLFAAFWPVSLSFGPARRMLVVSIDAVASLCCWMD